MKFKTTRKAIVAQSAPARLLAVGYCDMQHLLRGLDPVAYTSGVYGWNFDAYALPGDWTICTGYRNMPGRTPHNLRAYEQKAKAIWEEYKRPYDDRAADVRALLGEFLAQA